MTRAPLRAAFAACCGVLLTACALLSKAEPRLPRYFSPERPASLARVPAASAAGSQLRLGSVRSSSQLQERIVYRASAYERGYYEDRRWTERPEVYLRRALARALYEERGVSRAVSGVAPTLDVELVAFEELRGPAPRARIEVIITLEEDQPGSLQQTIVVEQPLRPAQDAALAAVDALAGALATMVSEIAERVLAQLAQSAAAPAAQLHGDSTSR